VKETYAKLAEKEKIEHKPISRLRIPSKEEKTRKSLVRRKAQLCRPPGLRLEESS
jgi:hypothetical protein